VGQVALADSAGIDRLGQQASLLRVDALGGFGADVDVREVVDAHGRQACGQYRVGDPSAPRGGLLSDQPSVHQRLAGAGVKLGTCPGFGGTQRLSRLVGKGRAIQLLATAEMIDAAEAYRIGLVNKVVAGEELMGAAIEMMSSILANGPLAVALCIEAVDRGLEMSLEEGLVLEANHFGLLASSEDMTEGMKAFLEKRTPEFRGK
jgi:hypothetical protein